MPPHNPPNPENAIAMMYYSWLMQSTALIVHIIQHTHSSPRIHVFFQNPQNRLTLVLTASQLLSFGLTSK